MRPTSRLRRVHLIFALALFLPLAVKAAAPGTHAEKATETARYKDFMALFQEWKEFQKPEQKSGVSDYSKAAMAVQYEVLGKLQDRLRQIDPALWPVSQQVDYKIIEAEMNGMVFEHRVLKPWSRNPAFYVLVHLSRSDVPEHEGPNAFPPIDTWTYDFPLNPSSAARLERQTEAIPAVLQQARVNLTGDAHDLWVGGIRAMRKQSSDLAALSNQVKGFAELAQAIERAQAATDQFTAWLESELPSKHGPSGVGIENYTWNLQKVHLVPYTWEQELTILQSELTRAHASLKLEEHRNRNLPPLSRIENAEQYDRLHNRSVDDYINFLKDNEIVTVRPYMEVELRAHIGNFVPAEGSRPFFYEVSYRDPLVLITHMHHWLELARMDQEPHPDPVRRNPLPYNMFDGRSEGLATGMEEMMMHAGLFDGRPHSKELVWIMLAERAARAIAGLYLHSNTFTMEQAVKFASKWTPRGWLPADSDMARSEQQLYLQQPAYGTSYIIGKIEIEHLLAEIALQQGGDFNLKNFMDEFRSAGLIPVSLIRWEITGKDDEIRHMENLSEQ